MLARKTVAGSELSKKLDAQLKARQAQEPQNSEESFKSATEGEETGSSDTEKVTSDPNTTIEVIYKLAENMENMFILVGSVVDIESFESIRIGGKNKKEKEKESEGARSEERVMGKRVVDSSPTPDTSIMAVCGAESGKMEESVKKIGGSESGEAAEGLVKLGQYVDELGSSVEETLADLLKKVSESYNRKKKRTSKAKIPGTARDNKKRKASPSDSAENPPTRGRATRSQLKQNKADLQKVLEENKRKVITKGRKKMAEPVEAVDLDEMNLVHQDKDVIEEVEVQTPKSKKANTSTKKSISVSKSAEPSTLAKRTRSAVKTKQVKIVEEEE
ncbi:CUE domain-containing protein 5-like [Nicotiana tomentosiformis]|uniref:CUE domain-containing protein 5-like n=1 Tax=Nicotiana tomentosiformis TaxID=4098 RepID=UPI00388C4E68